MKVMERQATNRVRTIKVPDGQQPQTEKETEKNVCAVHYPDSRITDNS
jgi:hypothetical protein